MKSQNTAHGERMWWQNGVLGAPSAGVGRGRQEQQVSAPRVRLTPQTDIQMVVGLRSPGRSSGQYFSDGGTWEALLAGDMLKLSRGVVSGLGNRL